MKKVTLLLSLFAACLTIFTCHALAQDFAFGGGGGQTFGFRNAIPLPINGVTKTGVTAATITPSANSANKVIESGYLNTFTNIRANRLPNGNDLSFNAVDIAVADIDLDGLSDVVVVSDDNPTTQINAPNLPKGVINSGRLTFFTGTGDGSFGLPVSLNTASSPTSIVIADINLDFVMDAIVGEIGQIEIFSGSKLTSKVVKLPLGFENNRVASTTLQRINSDGFLDLVVALNTINNQEGTLLVYQGDINASLYLATQLKTVGSIGSIVSNDGKLIPANRAIAGFHSNLPALQTPTDTIEKVDDDLDIAVATSEGLEIFENTTSTGNLTFTKVTVLPCGESPIAFIPADINNDKKTDLTIISREGLITSYLAKTSLSGYENRKTFILNKTLVSATLANLDNDQNIDIVIVATSDVIALTNNNSNFAIKDVFNFPEDNFPIFNPSAVAIGLVNLSRMDTENTSSDIVIADGFSTNSTGGVLFLSAADDNLPIHLRLFTNMSLATDFDSKGGANDVAVIEQTTATVYLLNNVSITSSPNISIISLNTIFANQEFIPTSATSFVDPLTKLNNLAITLVPRDPKKGSGLVIIAINDGSGIFSNPQQFRQFVASSGATCVRAIDLKNTGQASDLIYVDYLNNLVTAFNNDGNNFFQLAQLSDTKGFFPVSSAIADVNDDDSLDVLVLNSLAKGTNTNKNSSIAIFLGQGDGTLLATNQVLEVPGTALSIAGGLASIDNLSVPRVVDFNSDGFPDFAVNSTRGGAPALGETVVPIVSLILNSTDKPGQFSVQPPTRLFDDAVNTGQGSTPPGAALALDESLGGAALVSGRGGIDSQNLASKLLGAGVGGANNTLAVCDFNADDSPDLVATGSIRTNQNIAGDPTNLTPTNYRAVSYLVGNNTAGTIRLSRPARLREFTTDNLASGAANPRFNSGDTFVACATGSFAIFNNFVLDVLHLSINGRLFIDGNITSVLVGAPITTINRRDLNAPFPGGGRKVFVTVGETFSFPITATAADTSLNSLKTSFSLTSNIIGIQPPDFVKVKNDGDTKAIVTIDTNTADGAKITTTTSFLIVIRALRLTVSRSLPITDDSYFNLVVKPRAAPTITPIPNVNIEVGKIQTISLQIQEGASPSVTISKKCDKEGYVTLDNRSVIIAPKETDLGSNVCTITVAGSTGLTASTSFTINVKAIVAPIITSISFSSTDKSLVIGGKDFGNSQAKVSVNGVEVSSRIKIQTNETITLKGNKKKLNLKLGQNKIVVNAQGANSNNFILNLLQN